METVLRVLLFYLCILFGIRILGKREFSQLSPFELVTLLLIPELVQQSVVREDYSVTNGLIALSTLFSLVFLTSLLAHRSSRAEAVLQGRPTVLVYDGRFIAEHLVRERVSTEEVYGEMRKSGLERVEQVKWALLETDGKISFIPLDPADTQVKPRPDPVP